MTSSRTTDAELARQLDSIAFAPPVTLEDLGQLRDQIRALPWSDRPIIDVFVLEEVVTLTVDVGGRRFVRRYPV
jgi:hypothetical protein